MIPTFTEQKDALQRTNVPWPEDQPFPKQKLPPVKRLEAKDGDDDDENDAAEVTEWFQRSDLSKKYGRKVVFYVNGKRQAIRDISPTAHLVGYLRHTLGLTTTQTGCGQGHCGACTVVVSHEDPATGKTVHKTVNGCTQLLSQLDGCEVTTGEGIGSKSKGYHEIQKRMADENGTQCGFCTPGFVSQMYGLLLNDPAPSHDAIESNFGGNLCRCTGYRPILKAMHSFADDEGAKKEAVERAAATLSAPLRGHVPKPLYSRKGFYRPLELSDLFTILENHKDDHVQLAVGNTAPVVVDKYGGSLKPKVVVDIEHISELTKVTTTDASVSFGAAVTLTTMLNTANDLVAKDADNQTYKALQQTLKHQGAPQVRNSASWGGNMIIAKRHPEFPSDLRTFFQGANAELTLSTAAGTEKISVEDFFKPDFELPSTTILTSVSLPLPAKNVRYGSYNVSARAQNGHSIVNASFRVELDEDEKITSARFRFGGVTQGVLGASKAEDFVKDKPLISQTLKGALDLIEEECKEAPALSEKQQLIAPTEYRQRMALSLFYKFFLSLQTELPERLQSAITEFDRPNSTGEQKFKTDPSLAPISEPVNKISALQQAAGEVNYISDMPRLAGELEGAPVLSTEPNAFIESIDPTEALKAKGVVAFISAETVQALNGFNECGVFAGDYPIFATDQVRYVGQIIGMVLAEKAGQARKAAKLVKVNYRKSDEEPIYTIDEAIKRKSFHDQDDPRYTYIFRHPKLTERGDVAKGFAEAKHVLSGEIGTGAQEHWYMETQNAAAYPADGKLTVHSSCQNPLFLHHAVSRAVNLPSSKVTLIAARAGGAFGGKLTGAAPVACAASVAAAYLQRPVKFRLSRNEDMISSSKRDEFKCFYKVGFNDDGRITALEMKNFNNGGCSYDLSMGSQALAHRDGDNVYHIDNYKCTGGICKTNLPTGTAMRAPAHTSVVYFKEHIMELVAQHTGLDPAVVKEMHFYKDGQKTPAPFNKLIEACTIQQCFDKLKKEADYEQTVKDVKEFNEKNRWRKRGVSIVPLKYELGHGGKRQVAIVNIADGDGTVTVSTGGCEIGQGLNTKVAQAVAYRLGIPLEKVEVAVTSTEKTPFMGSTGGSTTSEACVKAAMDACDKLNAKLGPVKADSPDGITWPQLVRAATQRNLLLSETGWFAPAGGSYLQWSAGLMVVELDVLTGAIDIRRSDIVYDGGQSLNPKIDIGQIEGGFVQGLGMFQLEKILIDKSGTMVNNNPWDYKLPCSLSIPAKFNVTFLEDTPFEKGILGSKASGEPAYILSCGVMFAIRNAIRAVRQENDKSETEGLDLISPCTVIDSQSACKISSDDLTLDG